MREVIWSPEAIEDLLAIQKFISHDSPRFALLISRRIVEAVERLARFPESGRTVPEIGEPTLREIVWRNYRIIHRVSVASVEIVTVFHGARLYPGH